MRSASLAPLAPFCPPWYPFGTHLVPFWIPWVWFWHPWVLGILQKSPEEWLGIGQIGDDIDKNKVESLIKEREEARLSKNFERADQIRSELSDIGIEIEDTPKGTIWRSK